MNESNSNVKKKTSTKKIGKNNIEPNSTLIRINKGLKKEVEGYARRNYFTISYVLGDAITEYLEKYSSTQGQ